jgi:hypothetical protein
MFNTSAIEEYYSGRIGKIKVKLSFLKTWGSGGIAAPFLTLTPDGGKRSASRPGHFIPGGKVSGTRCIGSMMDLRAGLDAVE